MRFYKKLLEKNRRFKDKCKFQNKVKEVVKSSRKICRLPFVGCYFEKQSTQHAFIQFLENRSHLAGPLGLEIGYWPDQTDQNLGIGQTK